MKKRIWILTDYRFIQICRLLKAQDWLLAVYLVRLNSDFKLNTARKYLERLDKFEAYRKRWQERVVKKIRGEI